MNTEPDVRQQVMRRPEENQPYHLSRRLPSVGFMLFYSLVFFCLFICFFFSETTVLLPPEKLDF